MSTNIELKNQIINENFGRACYGVSFLSLTFSLLAVAFFFHDKKSRNNQALIDYESWSKRIFAGISPEKESNCPERPVLVDHGEDPINTLYVSPRATPAHMSRPVVNNVKPASSYQDMVEGFRNDELLEKGSGSVSNSQTKNLKVKRKAPAPTISSLINKSIENMSEVVSNSNSNLKEKDKKIEDRLERGLEKEDDDSDNSQRSKNSKSASVAESNILLKVGSRANAKSVARRKKAMKEANEFSSDSE